MSRFHSYINTAKKLIETFNGEKPFAIFLKQFFAENKKYGSKDRAQISALCYNYFRMGFAATTLPLDEKILLATFLCETNPSALLEKLAPEWNDKITSPIHDKLASLEQHFLLEEIFPFETELSDGIELNEFCKSFLVQPWLFIRIRPQTRTTVLKKLEKSKLSYQMVAEDCVQLGDSYKLEDFFILDKEVVVQDYNSQKVLDYLKNDGLEVHSQTSKKRNLLVWDCCAASGGKSILLNDIIKPKIDITVSDIRASIVLNLHQRFKKAVIKEYKYFIGDLTNPEFKPGQSNFDLIICDAPCTGSGTWSRTPEQLCFFKRSSIKEYNSLQKNIAANVLPHLRPGGVFIYITCSVFRNENEVIAEFIAGNSNCRLLKMQLLKGYDKRADNMFVAIFEKL
ncbi:MAG: Fmu (Sun) domain-containing protein [Ferruginibacter sp.]